MDCVLYLAANGKEDELNESLRRLFSFFIPDNPYPVVIYHEAGFDKSKIFYPVVFEQIALAMPPYHDEVKRQIVEFCRGFSLGYRNMCRWFSGELFKKLAGKCDYYMRLDTDSYLLAPVKLDVFRAMRDGGYKYAYLKGSTFLDASWAVKGLRNLVELWVNGEEIKTLRPVNSIPDGWLFYNNFEIGQVSWFLESDYWKMYQRIDESGGIYIHRWGDAPIRGLGVELFMPDKCKLEITQIRYKHQAFVV